VKGTESLVEITERRVFMPQLKKVEDYAQLLNDLKARIQAARTRATLLSTASARTCGGSSLTTRDSRGAICISCGSFTYL
jgi:hypothetical protein